MPLWSGGHVKASAFAVDMRRYVIPPMSAAGTMSFLKIGAVTHVRLRSIRRVKSPKTVEIQNYLHILKICED
jgi:hypothetical protein